MRGRATTLQDLREQRGLSRLQVCKELGITERHLFRLEREGYPLRKAYAHALAEVYDVPVDAVMKAAA